MHSIQFRSPVSECGPPGRVAMTRRRAMRARAGACAVALVAALLPGVAAAQPAPVMVVQSASTFEGNVGTRILVLPVAFIGLPQTTVTGLVSALPLGPGGGFNPATGAVVCGPGVDFEQFSNVPFTIPPNTPNGTLSVNIRICSDAVVEPDQHILVTLGNLTGAVCLPESCAAIGTIRNDDGTPTMSINSITTSEPLLGSKVVNFKVSLDQPSALATTVNFATRNGTARTSTSCAPFACAGDYVGRSGTLTIPAQALAGTISVTIFSDQVSEPDETFFVDLSNALNATLADASGRATIMDTTLGIGGFDLSPDDEVVRPGEQIVYSLDWTVPPNLVWRNLKSIDFRVRDGRKIALWTRWDEASNTFSLCRSKARGHDADDDEIDDHEDKADHGRRHGVVCSAADLPGSPAVLGTRLARLHLAGSSVLGSGPTGPSVTLQMAVSFAAKAAGRSYRLEVAAVDDFGNEDPFTHAGEVRVHKAGRR